LHGGEIRKNLFLYSSPVGLGAIEDASGARFIIVRTMIFRIQGFTGFTRPIRTP
jgi:hypothetical protein